MNGFAKLVLCGMVVISSGWGFFAHQKINRLAVFTLPEPMIGFYKKNIRYLTESAVNPDRRRYSVAGEAPRHFIDLDIYGDSAATLPRFWKEAVARYGEDSLTAHGIVPWHIYRMYWELKDAFLLNDPKKILRLSADLGHYVADAHVPLHTTSNYDGQQTGQLGIHAFWESRLPELYFTQYDFLVGRACYQKNVQLAAWQAVFESHRALDSVLQLEKRLSGNMGEKKFNFETKGKATIKVVAVDYARAYHRLLSGMVERRFRSAVKLTADIWYTAWVDAGQPDLDVLIDYQPTTEELAQRREEVKQWKKRSLSVRDHEADSVP